MKPIIAALREQGLLLIIFLDDILLIGENFSIVKENIQITIDPLTSLSLLVNLSKSILKPVQLIEFLGMIINSKTMEISLPVSKLDKITKQCNKLLKMQTTYIRDISTLPGLLEAARPTIHKDPLHYREIQFYQIEAYKMFQNYNQPCTLSHKPIQEIAWWKSKVNGSPILDSDPDVIIATDACTYHEWGATCSQTPYRTSGKWDLQVGDIHFNILELRAGFLH